MFSGLRTSDFMRRISFVEFTRRDLQSALPDIEAMGKAEGLDAHVRSARARFPEAGRP
jgi:histidinol dehydrogenase